MQTQQPTDIRSNPTHVAPAGDNDSRQEISVIPRESKPGVRTSEFWIMLAMVGVTLVATYIDQDSLARVDGWRFATFAVVAYIVSRGLAKIGTADRKIHDRN